VLEYTFRKDVWGNGGFYIRWGEQGYGGRWILDGESTHLKNGLAGAPW
jgi:hypothetical protein